MRRLVVPVLVASLALLAVVMPIVPATSATTGLVLTPNGIGHVRVGQTVAQAQKASGRRLKLYPSPEGGGGCRYASIVGLRAAAMVIGGRIARIDLQQHTKVRAYGGIRIGDPEARVLAAFGQRAVRTKHTYVPDGSYLTVGYTTGPYAGRGMRFETDGDAMVTAIYAGRKSAIRYVEGCA